MVLQVTGRSVPLGATVGDGGVNFSLFSRTATGVELLFFDREDDAKPSRVIPLDPVANRTYHYWHVLRAAVRRRADLRLPSLRPVRPSRAGCASTPQRSCSIRMVAGWSSLTATPRGREPRRATTPRRR